MESSINSNNKNSSQIYDDIRVGKSIWSKRVKNLTK